MAGFGGGLGGQAFGGGAAEVRSHGGPAEAAQAQREDAVREMLDAGRDVEAPDADGNTALHWAAWFRCDGLLLFLLERGARADAKNSQGETPVHWAAKSSNINGIQAMTKGGHGLLSLRDCDGFTPFVILAQNDNAPVMEWMYLRGVSIEEQDNWGRTGLHWACYKGHRKTVQWLLSRSANIAHRDHEGMTAIHWAALQGHEMVAEMLISVGAVSLLHMPDLAGDTPIDLAHRKKNRYLVISFHKCQLFQFLIGRPFLYQNNFASLFVAFVVFNIAIFVFIIAPGIWGSNLNAVLAWNSLMGVSLCLWYSACRADPGWLSSRTLLPQRGCGLHAFDADQPVESQMAQVDDMGRDESDDVLRLELEQSKHNYQRQLLTAARRRLDGAHAELQPLIAGGSPPRGGAPDAALAAQQLDNASFELRRRSQQTGESLGRERTAALESEGKGEYLELLGQGNFKQVCVVCRSRRELRSHHCKECGRCVRRLDHHCPWIDNCVGIGNQRTFYCFIVMLLATILGFYYCAVLYVVDAIVPAWTSGRAVRTLVTVSEWSWGPELRPLMVLLGCAFNSVWLAFVGALVARHTAYMAVNVTTYEVLTRPAHVQRRFPRQQGRFWFLRSCDLQRSLRSILGYWTLDMSQDAADFEPVGPGEPERGSGRGRRRSGHTAGDSPGGGPGDNGDEEGGGIGQGCDPDRLESLLACEKRDVLHAAGGASGVHAGPGLGSNRPPWPQHDASSLAKAP